MLSPQPTTLVTVPDPFMPLMTVRVTPDESTGNLMEAFPQTGSQCNLKTGVLGCGASDVSIMLHTTVMFIQHTLGSISPPKHCSTSGMLWNTPWILCIPELTEPISFTLDYFVRPMDSDISPWRATIMTIYPFLKQRLLLQIRSWILETLVP